MAGGEGIRSEHMRGLYRSVPGLHGGIGSVSLVEAWMQFRVRLQNQSASRRGLIS